MAVMLAPCAAFGQSWICDSPIMTHRKVVETYSTTTLAFAHCVVPDCQGEGDSLYLKAYVPQTMAGSIAKPDRFPLMVLFSGGGFYTGNYNMAQWPEAFVQRGYVVVTAEYRLGWDRNSDGVIDAVDFSDSLSSGHCLGDPVSLLRAVMRSYLDAHSAIKYVLAQPDNYPVDPDLIYVGGPSAGGSLAMTAAFASPQQMLDYWNQFTDSTTLAMNPCDMRYEVRECPLLGPSYQGSYRVRGVVNCWGQAIMDPLNGDPGPVDLMSFYASDDHVNAPDIEHVLLCDQMPLALGGRAMHYRQLAFGRCVKTIEDTVARHRTVFIDDVDSTDLNYSVSRMRAARANFVAEQANCLFKSSICGTGCGQPSIYHLNKLSEWLQAYIAVDGDSQGEPVGCYTNGSPWFKPILPPGGIPYGGLLIWPNPSAGLPISVAWDSSANKGTCTISDVTGRTVLEAPVDNRSTLAGSDHLGKGYYWMRVEDHNGTFQARFLMVE